MIKFRAWNQIDSEYINEINAVMSLDGSHIWWDINDSGEMKYEDDPGNYKLEQFTGLKDVNGNEIYEGDILENRKYRSIVKFANGKFLADVVGTISRFDLIGETHGSKVIGNVHENPELLEEDK
ncbi:YopX family protein [Lactiplantibacillus plantarum]|uniref:YopX family protein n=1 Tax=Lactiplantibacillus plantarum TaxID=1590 RepID=UPI001CED6D7B|nr:YopX family protein [Lactiplantibacillus plantarum]MEA5157525.1 YopX family protein [Lactiplantibacillus plantarum]